MRFSVRKRCINDNGKHFQSLNFFLPRRSLVGSARGKMFSCTCVLVYGKGALMITGNIFDHRSCHQGYCRVVHGENVLMKVYKFHFARGLNGINELANKLTQSLSVD